MALPFILGLALGAGAVIAYSKSDKLKQTACDILDKSKDLALNSKQKSEDVLSDVKNTLNASVLCIKEKKEELTLEKEKKTLVEEPKKRVKKTKVKEND